MFSKDIFVDTIQNKKSTQKTTYVTQRGINHFLKLAKSMNYGRFSKNR